MKKQFEKFNTNIRLTETQELDAKTKYDGVCKTLHNYYYSSIYNGTTKYLFGSYKKKTNIRPIVSDQDVDVLFYMPDEEFEKYNNYTGNGQSALLAKIKDILKNTYTTTDKIKAWGKVILIEFSEGKHNIELLPAWENEEGTFRIPNTENGGSWDKFDPRNDVDIFQQSNTKTKGQTVNLSRMIKAWKRNTTSLNLKSFQIENFVIDFLDANYKEDDEYFDIAKKFFEYLLNHIDEEDESNVQTALNHANKALEFQTSGKYDKACEEWKKIFGNEFPKWNTSIKHAYMDENYSKYEQYIEDMFEQDLDNDYRFKIQCDIMQDGFRKMNLINILEKYILKVDKKLEFYIKNNTVPQPYKVYWKVRNFGYEARNDLRGQITLDDGDEIKKETTSYKGEHFVECYIIKDNVCVARDNIKIPISGEINNG
ncbi:MAG: hypothetical protein JXQ68_02440 [Campylobacterales bacterium]|nr:hypothetical protein [Campylobacterales bacterium]